MKTKDRVDRFVIGRESNILRVDFHRELDPPAPRFPGAGAPAITRAVQRVGRGGDANL